MPSRATHVEARLAELPVGHPRQRENFHRTQVLKPTEMAFPHSPPTRHCTQMHPLSLQLAVALLPPSRSHRVGMEGRHSVDALALVPYLNKFLVTVGGYPDILLFSIERGNEYQRKN